MKKTLLLSATLLIAVATGLVIFDTYNRSEPQSEVLVLESIQTNTDVTFVSGTASVVPFVGTNITKHEMRAEQ